MSFRHGSTAIAILAMLGGVAMLAPPAAAQDDVANSKHNMSTRSGLTNYGEVCVYCHTPHGGQTQNAPLWNRNFSTATYQMYNNSYSSTIDMTVDASPTGVSLACLSCHDGTVGLDVIINRPNAVPNLTPSGNTMPTEDAANQFFANLGVDLRNDHPISVAYSTAADPAFNPVTSAKVNGELPLYLGKVQCGTCHNPHNTTNSPFLRKSNSGSALCKTCHIK
ncbi:MAG: cytochrome c3 family protein [Gemmatimonadales bacterium]|nr:cytochrome c3 family protein [Gemmatimonadales bacterium]